MQGETIKSAGIIVEQVAHLNGRHILLVLEQGFPCGSVAKRGHAVGSNNLKLSQFKGSKLARQYALVNKYSIIRFVLENIHPSL